MSKLKRFLVGGLLVLASVDVLFGAIINTVNVLSHGEINTLSIVFMAIRYAAIGTLINGIVLMKSPEKMNEKKILSSTIIFGILAVYSFVLTIVSMFQVTYTGQEIFGLIASIFDDIFVAAAGIAVYVLWKKLPDVNGNKIDEDSFVDDDDNQGWMNQ